jgi:hypothetical protein
MELQKDIQKIKSKMVIITGDFYLRSANSKGRQRLAIYANS